MKPSAIINSRRALIGWMVALVLLVSFGATANVMRELDEALERMAKRHGFLAFVIAQDLSSRLGLLQQNERLSTPDATPREVQQRALARLLGHLEQVQRAGSLTILLRETDGFGFHTADGRVLSSQVLERGVEQHLEHVVLTREEARSLGMPMRRAVAGFASVDESSGYPALRVVVLSTGQLEADRYRAARRRTAFSIAAVAAIIVAFGIVLLRQQRRALELGAELERASLERDRDAELARADRFAMLATMSSGIAHELGGPLTILYGRLDQLADVAKHEPAAERAHAAMGEQLARVRAIVRGFMALARGEAPSLVQTAPAELAREAEELVAHRFARADVTLCVEVDPALGPVTCDPPLFVQALVNLLVNACQASPQGSTVTLRIGVLGGHICFVVEDRGDGIGAEVADRAHAPFFTTRAHAGGTGLGLAIANEIVQQHRGSLRIEPRDGAGTRATIELHTT